MRVITKSEVAQFLTLETLAKLQTYKSSIKSFEKKYKKSFKQFEKYIKSNKEEVFEEWDDYIEWKAFYYLDESLNAKLKDLRNGNFKVA